MRDALMSPTRSTMRRVATASIVANTGIVVTGGAVRLTGSGLGCPTWPRCDGDSLTPTAAYGIHGGIEFGNRLLTFVLAAVALVTLIAAIRYREDGRPRRDLRRLAVVLFVGIPAQAVLGGVTVLVDLNPWVVMWHFVLSAALIAVGVVMRHRVDEDDAPATARVARPVRLLGQAVLWLTFAVVVVGTIVTGSGPHAGDADAVRTGLEPRGITQLHADMVFLLVGLTIGLAAAVSAAPTPADVRRAVHWVGMVLVGQAAIGMIQNVTGLPVLLVGLHMLGSCLAVIAAMHLVLTMRERRAPLAAGSPTSDPRFAHAAA
jgi:cytochrome c oxidase assembly protein subunit 15